MSVAIFLKRLLHSDMTGKCAWLADHKPRRQILPFIIILR